MAHKLSRRALTLTALGAAQTRNAQSKAAYTGALDGFEAKVDLEAFDPVLWTERRYRSASLKLTFHATSRAQAEAWQRRLRGKLNELLGDLPSQRLPLNPQTLEVTDFRNYRREKLVFESRPGLSVLAYLMTPLGVQPPYATVMCVPGHGRGVEDIVGIDSEGRNRTDKSGYQHDFAVQVLEQGMAAVAIEPLAFGCRRDLRSRARGLEYSACQPVAGAALLLGETLAGWRVWDVVRTIDWIETRTELDRRRLGCMGISGGGACTLFSAALEPRIRAAMISGYLNTFRDSVFSVAHCIDNYVPGILKWAEMYDIAGLIAPRPLFVESADRDQIFPIEASRRSFARVREIYGVFGAEGMIQQEIFGGRHEFHGVRGLRFLAKYLV